MTRIPCWANRIASTCPTGPYPTTRTSVSTMSDASLTAGRAGPAGSRQAELVVDELEDLVVGGLLEVEFVVEAEPAGGGLPLRRQQLDPGRHLSVQGRVDRYGRERPFQPLQFIHNGRRGVVDDGNQFGPQVSGQHGRV